MLQQLEENLGSRAFHGLIDRSSSKIILLITELEIVVLLVGYGVEWEDSVDVISCKYTLTNKKSETALTCTALDWNCTGSVIVVGYAVEGHSSWCTHRSSIAFVSISNVTP